jgi:hypothetical protein
MLRPPRSSRDGGDARIQPILPAAGYSGFGVAVIIIGATVGGIVGGTVGVTVGRPAAARKIGMLDCSATPPAALVV